MSTRARLRLVIAGFLLLLAIPEPGSAQSAADSAASMQTEALREYQQGTIASLHRAGELWARALPIFQRLGDRVGEFGTLYFMGQVRAKTGRPDSALAYLRRALVLKAEVGDREALAALLTATATSHSALGSSDSALAHFHQALAIERELGDRKTEAALRVRIGTEHKLLGLLDSSLSYFRRALEMQRDIGDRAGEGATLTEIGNTQRRLGRLDSATAYYHQALPARREAGDRVGEAAVLNNIGLIHADAGRPELALPYLYQALAIERKVEKPFEEGITLTAIGRVYNNLARPDSSRAYYTEALRLQRQTADRAGQVESLLNIGAEHLQAGRADSALASYYEALAIAREVRFRTGEGAALRNIGAVQVELGRPDSALAYYQRTLAIAQDLNDRRSEGATLTQIGQAQGHLNRPDSALAYFHRALAIARDVGNRQGEAHAQVSIGLVHGTLGRSDSAQAYYRQALANDRATRNRRDEGGTLWAIGVDHSRRGSPDSARAYYREALAIVREVNPQNEGIMLRAIGSTYYHPRSLTAAVAYFDSSAASIAASATHAGGEANRVSYGEVQVELYATWALAWLAREPEVGPNASALAALAASERGRAQALLQLVRQASTAAAPGGNLVAEGARLLEPVARGGTAVLSYLVTADTVLLWLAIPGQKLEVRRRPVSRDSLARWIRSLRAALGAGEAPRGQVALRGGATPDGDTAAPGRGVVGTAGSNKAAFDRAGRLLADLLLPRELHPGPGVVRELVIIPHGLLGLIPFAALPLGSSGTPLGSRYALRYAPSLAVLGAVEKRTPLPAGRAMALRQSLVVGNPLMPAKSSLGETFELPSLPGAGREAAQVAAQLGGGMLTGAQASETEVRRRISSAPLVHLATHGYAYASEARARQSFVALAPSPQDDGFLTVGDVLDDAALTLRAELVVLSACQTGLGDLKQAEGTVGLQRAFLARGARSVLVSLWSVSDAATTLLMKGFYAHWLEDTDRPSKSEALRRAQEGVRKTAGFEAPQYWAAFQLVGAQ